MVLSAEDETPWSLVEEGVQEYGASGPNEFRQLVGGDPYKSLGGPDLRIPHLATNPLGGGTPYNRYLFLLSYVEVPANERIVVCGLRQKLDIGTDQGNANTDALPLTFFPTIFPVTTDNWCFVDGNVSWHLMRIAPGEIAKLSGTAQVINAAAGGLAPSGAAPTVAPGLAFKMSKTPALLYQTITLGAPGFYTSATAYTPPNGGRPWGEPLTNDLGTFYDLRFPRSDAEANDNRGIVVDGQCAVALFASVKQTNPATRVQPKTPLANLKFPLGMTPEDQFLSNFPGTNSVLQAVTLYWTVGGSIIWRKCGASRGG